MERVNHPSSNDDGGQSHLRRRRLRPPLHSILMASALLCLIAPFIVGCGGAPDTEHAEEIGTTESPVQLHATGLDFGADCYFFVEIREEWAPEGVYGEADSHAYGSTCVDAGAGITTILFDKFESADSGALKDDANDHFWSRAQQWGHPFVSRHFVDYLANGCLFRGHIYLSIFKKTQVEITGPYICY